MRPNFLISYSDRALSGEFQPAIGRTELIKQIITTLNSHSGDQHPLLLGQPGVGKTQLVQSLALSIAKEKSGIHVYEVDQTIFSADASYINQTEGRLKSLLDFAQHNKGSIFFIDEFHRFIGTGASSNHQSGVEQLLKPAMTNGSIKIVAATTVKEYEYFIRPDAALDRRFCHFNIPPLNQHFTLEVLNILNRQEKILGKPNFSNDVLHELIRLSARSMDHNEIGEPSRSIKLFGMLKRSFQEINTSGASLKSPSGEVLKLLVSQLEASVEVGEIREMLIKHFSGTPGALIADNEAMKALNTIATAKIGMYKGAA